MPPRSRSNSINIGKGTNKAKGKTKKVGYAKHAKQSFNVSMTRSYNVSKVLIITVPSA